MFDCFLVSTEHCHGFKSGFITFTTYRVTNPPVFRGLSTKIGPTKKHCLRHSRLAFKFQAKKKGERSVKAEGGATWYVVNSTVYA